VGELDVSDQVLIQRRVGEVVDSLGHILAGGFDGNVVILLEVDSSVLLGWIIRRAEQLALKSRVGRPGDVLAISPLTIAGATGRIAAATAAATTGTGTSTGTSTTSLVATISTTTITTGPVAPAPTAAAARAPTRASLRRERGSLVASPASGLTSIVVVVSVSDSWLAFGLSKVG